MEKVKIVRSPDEVVLPKRTVKLKSVVKPHLAKVKRDTISEVPTASHWVLKEVLSAKDRHWELLRPDTRVLKYHNVNGARAYIVKAAQDQIKKHKLTHLLVYVKSLQPKKRGYYRYDRGGIDTALTREEYGVEFERLGDVAKRAAASALPERSAAVSRKTRPLSKTQLVRPKTKPVTKPVTKPKTKPATKPTTKPAKTKTKPAPVKTKTKPVVTKTRTRPIARTTTRVLAKAVPTKAPAKPIVEFVDLSLSFVDPVKKTKKRVIDGVSLTVNKGEALGLIGESGSGKTVLTSLLTGILPPNAVVDGGKLLVNGVDVSKWSDRIWQSSGFRGAVVGQVFQNPLTTLNPVMKIGEQMSEGILRHKVAKGLRDANVQSLEILEKMRIENPERVLDLYPHQLSGGMRQRVVIACILALRPSVVVLDEPTTALDPTVQAEVLEIVKEAKADFDVTFIYITHDMGVVATVADRIAVMYAGSVVEVGTTREILLNARHPYTWGLLLSMPEANASAADRKLWSIPGTVPSNITDLVGDPFAPRNPYAVNVDFVQKPAMYRISRTHFAATRLLDTKAPEFKPPELILRRWRRFNERNVK